jgi:hypothetical protein
LLQGLHDGAAWVTAWVVGLHKPVPKESKPDDNDQTCDQGSEAKAVGPLV